MMLKNQLITFSLILLLPLIACNASKKAERTEAKRKQNIEKKEQLEKDKKEFEQKNKKDL